MHCYFHLFNLSCLSLPLNFFLRLQEVKEELKLDISFFVYIINNFFYIWYSFYYYYI